MLRTIAEDPLIIRPVKIIDKIYSNSAIGTSAPHLIEQYNPITTNERTKIIRIPRFGLLREDKNSIRKKIVPAIVLIGLSPTKTVLLRRDLVYVVTETIVAIAQKHRVPFSNICKILFFGFIDLIC